jgi:hypothetical protein
LEKNIREPSRRGRTGKLPVAICLLRKDSRDAVTFDANCANEREFQLAKIRVISVKGFWFAFKIKPNSSGRKVMQGICDDTR